MSDDPPPRGLIDTSVVIDLHRVDLARLPGDLTVSAISLAELAAGVHAADDPDERARRQALVQFAEATLDPVPFDAVAARAYAQLYTVVIGAGRKARGGRALDLLIAATALAERVPFYTRNAADFQELGAFLQVVQVELETQDRPPTDA